MATENMTAEKMAELMLRERIKKALKNGTSVLDIPYPPLKKIQDDELRKHVARCVFGKQDLWYPEDVAVFKKKVLEFKFHGEDKWVAYKKQALKEGREPDPLEFAKQMEKTKCKNS